MGGAVQSFSSPMLAQGMQGGLSGFGTSGLQTFADGGQTTTIQDILAKYKAMESAKPKQDPTTDFLNKSWEGKNIDDYIMYSDKYKKGGKMAKGGIFEHGLQEGDKIVKQVDEKYLIVASKGGVYSVVDIEKGSRFIVGLDDSKTSGKRKSVKAGVKEAMDYINYLKSTKMANGGKFAQGGTLEDAKIYVADLAEYNNGRLVGKWLELSDYSSGAEVMEAIQEMLDEQTKKDKNGDVHEEYAIHDYEGFPRSFYSEYMGESDFDALYEMMKVADSSNLPLEVLMEAVSDLGYEDNPERVAEAYYTSIPASMGNEWRDFAYEYIDSIGSITESVSKPEYYFDFENFGSDVRMDYSEEELEEMGYNDLSDEELGEQMADEMGGVKYLGEKLIETYFDYDKFGRELEYDFIAVRGKDGDYYFFNRNFAKGGEVKNKKEVDIKNTRYRVVVTNSSSNENRQGLYFIEASSKERAEEIALEKFKKEFGTRRGISIYVDSIKEVPMQDGKERTRKYFVRLRNSKGSEMEVFIIDAFEETTAVRRAFAMFRKKYERPSAYDDDAEVFFPVIETIYPIDEIRKEGVTTYRRTFAKGGEVGDKLDKTEKYWYERIKNSNSKSVSTYNLTTNDILILNRLSSMGLVDKQVIKGTQEATYTLKEKMAQGGEIESLKVGSKIGFLRPQTGRYEYAEVLSIDENNVNLVVRHPKKVYLDNYFTETKERISKFSNTPSEDWKDGRPVVKIKYAKGGKIGFEGLAKKVAKRYVGRKVSKEYQAEYGKTYDAKEAKEVGNKVAGKVYQQQVAKKKIVRKLQRKTN